ncbi:hypothetical protein AVEN_269842-1 [Araneus ventricosus]|uniref:Uncharacterized protein n=1 Tax=Araneus ventricosus TaxID=182803 RepID=A0A4Y2CGP8_ARAVE|nr:hypothetical protein AVEN_269842-1 [Araneus ventricosus]
MDKWLKIGSQRPEVEKNDNTNDNDGPTYNKLIKTVDESNDIVSTSKNIERNALPNKKLRKYQEEFINYGFTYCVVNGEEHPLCKDKLANESMKPAKLKRHFETKHKDLVNKSETFFKKRAESMKNQNVFLKKYTTIPEKALRASL